MLALNLGQSNQQPTVLCIGAHCDDIEIGCGATLIRWAREYPGARFVWAIFAGDQARAQESRAAAAQLCPDVPDVDLRFFEFPDGYFPAHLKDIKDAFEELKGSLHPDVIFTHQLDDRHQDHRLMSELTWNTFRSHLVLEYEIPKYEGDLGHPNVFVAHEAREIELKVRCLMECFPSQRSRRWFTEDTFRAIARLRGIECGAPGGFAEAFHARKIRL